MMENLKKGMYVRFKYGIAKILDVCDKFVIVDKEDKLNATAGDAYLFILKEFILKASFNIIDLIEAGDYVNGKLINYIEKFKDGSIYLYFDEHGTFVDYQIESIVTHEQFENMKYRIENI